jgi:hypothetical protein
MSGTTRRKSQSRCHKSGPFPESLFCDKIEMVTAVGTNCLGKARADCQCGELIDRIAPSAPVRKLLFIELLGHARVPFSGYWPDHCAGVKLTTIDAHRAAEAAADLEGRLDDGVAREARQDRLEIRDFPGRDAGGHSVPPRGSGAGQDAQPYMRRNGPAGRLGEPGELRSDSFRQIRSRRRHKPRARQNENPGGGGRGFRKDEQGENSIVQQLSNSITQ